MLRHSGMTQIKRYELRRVPERARCEDRHRLLDEFLNAIHELNALLQQQTQAVIEGDLDFSRFDVLIYFAQQAKDKAKYAWIEHVEIHGCGG